QQLRAERPVQSADAVRHQRPAAHRRRSSRRSLLSSGRRGAGLIVEPARALGLDHQPGVEPGLLVGTGSGGCCAATPSRRRTSRSSPTIRASPPREEGLYYIFFEVASAGLLIQGAPFLMLEIKPSASPLAAGPVSPRGSLA